MKTEIFPLYDRVVLRPMPTQATSSGVYIPRNTAERSQLMTVVCVGDGNMDDGTKIKMQVKEGDTVLVSKYAGTEITVTDEKLFILKQCDILAKTGEINEQNNDK